MGKGLCFLTEMILHVNIAFFPTNSLSGKISGKTASTFISSSFLVESIKAYKKWISNIESYCYPLRTTFECEFNLGKRGLYPDLGGTYSQQADMGKKTEDDLTKINLNKNINLTEMHLNSFGWLMHLSDGSNSNFDIAEKSNIPLKIINESIAIYLKKVHNLVVGERTAEDIKIKIGSAFPDDDFDNTSIEVRGLHLLSGLPRSITLTSGEIREAMADPLNKIVEAVKRTLERTPPELAADIVDRGIMLAGGGALVRGISDLLSHETGIFTHIAENPLLCVVNGCGEVLDDFKKLKRVVDTPDFIRNAIRD